MKYAQFDRDGYPTEETLEAIEKWKMGDVIPWMEFIRDAWMWKEDYFSWDGSNIRISTGGWSGNESIIYAMQRNAMWHILWQSSKRGGHHTFTIPRTYISRNNMVSGKGSTE